MTFDITGTNPSFAFSDPVSVKGGNVATEVNMLFVGDGLVSNKNEIVLLTT